MRKFRRLIRLLVFLAIALYVAAHLAIRTDRGRAWAEARLSEKTGLDVSAEAVRFTWGLGYRLTNVRASFRDAAGTEREIFSAPQATATCGCHGAKWLKASRAVLNVTQDSTGAWTPAFGTRFSAEDPAGFFRSASTTFGSLFFALEDATITVSPADGSSVSYYGASWKNFPVFLHGNDKIHGQFIRQGLLQVQCYVTTPADGAAVTHSGAPIALDQNWLVVSEDLTIDLAAKPAVAAPAPASVTEPSPEVPPAKEETPAEPEQAPPSVEPAPAPTEPAAAATPVEPAPAPAEPVAAPAPAEPAPAAADPAAAPTPAEPAPAPAN